MNNDVELIPVKGVLPTVQAQSDNVIYVPQAHKNKAGIVKEGEGINIENGVVSLDTQTVEDMIDANKWVSYGFQQNLTEDEKGMARHNIGAGDNDFTGSWLDLANRPQETVDFAESERQKSKNLFNTTKAENVGYNWNGTLANNDSPNYISCGFIKIKPNTNYIFSYSDSSITMRYTGALFYTLDKTYIRHVECNGNTFITPSNAEYMICQFWFESNPMNYKDIIQIEEGSVATDYQQYNGQITHNGDAPVVFAESERQKSKNLFKNIHSFSQTSNGITVSVQDNLFTISGTATTGTAITILNEGFLAKANVPYTLSMQQITDTSAIFDFGNNGTNATTGVLTNNVFNVRPNKLVVTKRFDVDTWLTSFIWVSSGVTINTSFRIQIEEGTVATDYQPYGGGSIAHIGDAPIVFAEEERQKSKNLLNIPNASTQTLNGVTLTIEDNIITLNGTTTGFTTFYKPHQLISTNVGKYAFSFKHISGNISGYSGGYSLFNQVGKSELRYPNTSIINDIASPTDYNQLRIAISGNITFDNFKYSLQYEQGDVATDYQPYNGAIVHEKQLKEAVEKRELQYDHPNTIDIATSTLTTFQQYFDLFNVDKNSVYRCSIGNLDTNNFKRLVGVPTGFGNFVNCYITLAGIGNHTTNNITSYKLIALNSATVNVAIGYIYKVPDSVGFTGWTIIGG